MQWWEKELPIQIITAANQNYLKYLACHLVSLGQQGSMDFPMLITVIQTGINRVIQQELEKTIPAPHRVQWFEVCLKTLQKIQAPLAFTTCSPHYYRLLIPFLLRDSSRAIYLDADTLVLEPLSELWSLDLNDFTIGAVRDYIPTIQEAIENWEDFALNPDDPYFNSGVLLINLNKWRAQDISNQVLTICQKNQQFLLAQKKWPQYDQYGLNVALHAKWKEIGLKWNYGTDRAPSQASIIHFIGNGKIESPKCHLYFNQIFSHHLMKIPKGILKS